MIFHADFRKQALIKLFSEDDAAKKTAYISGNVLLTDNTDKAGEVCLKNKLHSFILQ